MKNIKVSLTALPLFFERSPSLALAYLCSFLRQKGVNTYIHGFSLKSLPEKLKSFLRRISLNPDLFLQLVYRRNAHGKKFAQELLLLDVSLKYWEKDILRKKPDIVGFSVLSANSFSSLLLAERIKARDKKIKIVFGGPECDYETNERFFIETGFVDAVVIGEGEKVLFELVKKTVQKGFAFCPGTIIRNDGKILDGGCSKQVIEMDDLPVPDYSDYADYGELYSLPTSFNRGCTGKCRFCRETKYWKKYRQMSIDCSVEMLATMKKKYNNSNFLLNQSLLNAKLDWLSHFCDKVIEKKMEIFWRGNARIHPKMDRAFMDKMSQAGCWALFFGIESGSSSVMKHMNKGITPHQAAKVIKTAFESNIWVHIYWILGYPTETASDFKQTIDFIVENIAYINSCFFHVFSYDPIMKSNNEFPYGAKNVNTQLTVENSDCRIDYKHHYYHRHIKSEFFLKNRKLINKFVSLFNHWKLKIPVSPQYYNVEKYTLLKKISGLSLLLSLFLLEFALQEKSLQNELLEIKSFKKKLDGIYNRLFQKYGLDYDWKSNRLKLSERIMRELIKHPNPSIGKRAYTFDVQISNL